MPGTKIKAILFDLGETLVNFGRVNATDIFRQGARLSYDFLKSCGQPVGNFKYYCWLNLMALRIRQWLSGITRRDFNSLALLRGIGTKKGISLDRPQWQYFAWLWYEPLSKVGRAEPKIKETLTALKKMGLKLGIVSNTFITGSSLEKHLEQLGILDFFSVRMYSYEFDFRKPDVRIFKIAAERIDEMPENIMFVGDRINTDIRPAVKAGMHAVLKEAYTNTGRGVPKGVWKINQLSELPGLVEKINGETASVILSGAE
ncbi:MAG: HAD family hydrolase [Sedimentisphaerales bacterium]|nr:HAD family hydrolase [Sedimentisphaerales bacterium]